MGKFNRTKEIGSSKVDNIGVVAGVIGMFFLFLILGNSIYMNYFKPVEDPTPLPKGTIEINGFTTPYFEDEWGRYTRLQVKECYRVDWTEENICDREIKKIYFD
jgi:hypothetical protein|tara:strand:+ start:10366 stop:10677 length:312 start_codon:yes stop_codon:yes gene_type:complete